MGTVGGFSGLDAGAAAPDGRAQGWLSGGHHVSGGGYSSWLCGRREGGGAWLGHVFYV